jgi:DNA-binding CsgD family transcriptional regulator
MAMSDTHLLLQLTADVHSATRDTTRWPQVWNSICDWFDCPEIFGAVLPPDHNISHWPERLGRCADRAGQCARSASCHCGNGPDADEGKRLACLATVAHLTEATLNARTAGLPLLEALPMPMLLCRVNRQLVFANRMAQQELENSRWLTVRDDRLWATDPKLERALVAEFERLSNAGNNTENWMVGAPLLARESANIAMRRISGQGADALLLLSIIVHADALSAEHLDRLGKRHGLPPRQKELAGHLLSNLSLNEAAARMGITRRTARDHLKGLFRATGTSRQGELMAYLVRNTVG